ncbi:MAG: hypothetical protein LKJ29_05085 [Lactobacillus sp.]|jgi:hypothetical protein|uniref:hypothetical protein n=1 Tax=Lacticaseibacillus suilingensis TaxID=2799577 RepID=UPI0022E60A7D|nr:hypothetical protein [Lacticaseibacillus suilingensis]MCI1893772.1 hypothetical protein [Lactobacillus sp.]MCI1918100.1 hypothetical protein [Lactobacillus sp.]MCI1941407.1 hypothetical protein [Lactobacillus sp.]MCI1971952.1 hypothetical protein [Lactobacillus sp.]MCI2017797.1 hypothetical protein [Lactobacillus sp.]
MKKQWLGLAVLAVIVLGGCGQKQATKPSSNSAKSSKVSSKKAKAKTKASSSSSQASSSTAAPAQSHLATLQSALRKQIPGAKFPQQDPAASGQALNVAAAGTSANYKLYFSFGAAAAFQASSLPRSNAPYVLTKTTPESTAAAEAADAAINYQALQAGLPTVALGDGLTGTKEGAAGSTYVTWHEGRWSLVASGVNQNQEDPAALAKQAVSFLAQASLPIPATHGAVVLHVAKSNDRVNTVAWRENSAYYQLSGIDPLMTLRLATLLR